MVFLVVQSRRGKFLALIFFRRYREEHADEPGGVNFADVYKIQGQAWRDLPEVEKAKYEELARQEADKFRTVIKRLQETGRIPGPKPKKNKYVPKHMREETEGDEAPDGSTDMGGGVVKKADGTLIGPDGKPLSAQEAKAFESGYQPRLDRRASHWSQHFKPEEIMKRPDRVGVVCNGVKADFLVKEFRMLCQCSQCGGEGKSMSATEFEKHAGMGQAKKWKASIRMVEPARMPIGRWLDGGQRRKRADADDDKGGKGGKGKKGKREEAHGRRKKLDYEIIRVKWSVDRCAVCDDDRDFDFDQLVTCEGCGISVHQSCYGIPEIPDDAVGYLCRACEHTGGVVSETPLCSLCPVEGGALKPTTTPGQWCHSACCQWIPETTVLDVDTMEPIDQIKSIQRERWELLCTVCKQRMGAKIQCSHPGCYLAYHPLCARAAGLFMEASLEDEEALTDEDSPLTMVSYCHRHCRVDTERAALWVGEDGLSIGKHGALVESKADHTKKLTKGARKKLEEDKRRAEREEEARKRAEDDALDEPEDEWGAARCRRYVPQGHPRTEAGEETIVAASGPSMRRQLQHGLGRGRGGADRRRREREAWVQCENCAKWRRVPQSVAEAFSRADAGQWTCETSGHPRINTCEVPQELPDDDIDARIAMGDDCPFYDDDDLDPPELIADPDDDERAAAEDDSDDDSDDADDDDDSGDGDADAAAAMEPDAPPGGWDAFELDDDAAGAVTMMDASTEELFGEDVVVARPEAKENARRANEPEEEDIQPAKRARAEESTPKEAAADEREPRAVEVKEETAEEALARAENAATVDAARTEEPKPEPEAEDDGVKEDGDSGDDDEDEDGADQDDADADGNADAAAEEKPSADVPSEVPAAPPASLSDLPDVKVLCKNLVGTFRPRDNMILCSCTRCRRERDLAGGAERPALHEPNRWEAHAGMAQAKKWKTSIRVVDPNRKPAPGEKRAEDEDEDEDEDTDVALGDWLDENDIHIEVIPQGRASRSSKAKDPNAKPKPAGPPRKKRPSGKAALAGLAIDIIDEGKAADDVETKAGELVGKRVRINPNAGPGGAPLVLGGPPNKPPKWVEGIISDMKSSRGGCRHRVVFDDGGSDWYTLNRCQTEWPDEEGAEPDLSFLPQAKSIPSSRRGLSGIAAMLELSSAAPAPLGKLAPKRKTAKPLSADAADGEDEDDDDEEEDKPETETEAEPPRKPRRAREREAWIRCSNPACAKWRRVPESAVVALDEEKRAAAEASSEAAAAIAAAAAAGDMEAAAAAAMTVKAPEAWTCARNGDSRRSACDAPEEFDVFEISRRIAAAAEGLAPESMYADGSVRGDGEGGPGDSENEDDEDPATDNGLIGVLPDDLPEVVTVVCRQHAGDYYPRTGMIRCLCPPCVEATKEGRDDESLQEPNRWEIHCGMGQAKKWKASVRVILAGHRTMPVGKWLQGFGIAVSSRRAPRQARQWGPKRAKLNKMKKKGLLADEENIYRRLEPMRNTKSGGVTRGPPPRSGKRAFLELIPYVVRGAKLRSRGGNNRGGFATPGAGGDGGAKLDARGQPDLSPAVAEGVTLPVESRVFTPEEWEADQAARLAAKTTGAVAVAAMAEAAKIVDEGKGVRERIAESQRLLKDRLTFGKSNIHGWGLVAKRAIKAGTMVIPFRGESLRPSVANLRERAYEASGHDCYLLMADPSTVIDTTMKGNIARFTNHSCNPNMYTKIVSVDGTNHIIFFTRVDVAPGEEMTYNYRFDAESGRVPCYCGAHNCRGFLC